ncbi:MAG: phage tail protein, partial [Terriglobales bacterium]
VLKALLKVLAEQAAVLEQDVARLHENWFIETCDEWVVPYIGDLLGVRRLHELGASGLSQRARVANTIRYRRRKGTATMLEQLARDVTGWPARAVEFFQLLATTQHLNHVRLGNVRTPDLRDTDALELLDGPFESAAHTGEVRSIVSGRGRYNIPNVGLFLWRLQSYEVARSTARLVGKPSDGRFTFSPLGDSQPLFNRPQTEREITHLAEEINVPGRLRRRLLHDELNERRLALKRGAPHEAQYFHGDHPALQVFEEGSEEPLKPEELVICHLRWEEKIKLGDVEKDWEPPESQTFAKKDGAETTTYGTRLALDPVLGRLVYLKGVQPKEPLLVSYSYGFSGDVGGGPYNRRDSVEQWLRPSERPVTWQIGVTRDKKTLSEAPDPTQLRTTLQDAIAAWKEYLRGNPKEPFGLVTILDSATYGEDLTGDDHRVEIPAGSKLAIVAAHWPVGADPVTRRITGQLVPEGRRPHLLGNLSVKGTAPRKGANPGEFVLDGLLLQGKFTVLVGNLAKLHLAHCTLVPSKGGLEVNESDEPENQNAQLSITIDHSICDLVTLPETVPTLRIRDSTVGKSIEAAGTRVAVESSTVLGTVEARSLEASNSVFAQKVKVLRRQEGCVRFCYVPPGSALPRRFRCQPDLAVLERATELEPPGKLSTDEEARVQVRVAPVFASTRYGDPTYVQLSLLGAPEIRTGAEDGSEMGVFRRLKQPQREASLRVSLDEYLRVGLDAGIFYVT